jgi:inner membrane protein
MPTILSHTVAALGIGTAFFGRKAAPGLVLGVGAVCSMLPDADVIGFRLGIRYGDLLGHRGLSHSLLFAAALAALATPVARVEGGPQWGKIWTYLLLATASHGLLDALTDGGLGVAFFAPFDTTRYFFPFRPIEVSPIGPGFFSRRGLMVIASEMLWIWLPSLVLAGMAAVAWRKAPPA